MSPDFVARLLRSRPGAVGEHFVMHWKPLPAPDAGGDPAGVLFLAVPKRQLVRAVDRNLVRRIAREAWRASGLSRLPIAVLVKLRRRPDWFAASGVRRKRKGVREELDALFADPALQRNLSQRNALVSQRNAPQETVPQRISDTLRRGSP